MGSPFILKIDNFMVKAFKNWPNFLTARYFKRWILAVSVTTNSFPEFKENLWVGSLHEQQPYEISNVMTRAVGFRNPAASLIIYLFGDPRKLCLRSRITACLVNYTNLSYLYWQWMSKNPLSDFEDVHLQIFFSVSWKSDVTGVELIYFFNSVDPLVVKRIRFPR